jgi:hypothetical protein
VWFLTWSWCIRFADHHVTYTFWDRIRKYWVASYQRNKLRSVEASAYCYCVRVLLRVASRATAPWFHGTMNMAKEQEASSSSSPPQLLMALAPRQAAWQFIICGSYRGQKAQRRGEEPHVSIPPARLINVRKTALVLVFTSFFAVNVWICKRW